MTLEIRAVIPGRPKPKGSLKCVGRNGRHQLVEDNADTSVWRSTLVAHALRVWPVERRAPAHVPVGVEVTFTIDRPTSHYGTGKNARVVKPSAPAYPVTRSSYDVDKLVRLALDALQDAQVLADDATVVDLIAAKRYVGGPAGVDVLGFAGVVIRLWLIDE